MKKILFSLILLCGCSVGFTQKLTVASYNVRYDSKDDAAEGNGWKQRCPVQCQLIKFNDFDIFGAQEVLHHQLNDLLGELTAYGYVGVGRDDGKTQGEYAPVFYKKDKYEVLKSGHFWLSEKTDYPNKGWDAVLPRICTWVEFREKGTKFRFWFFNLHMDHVGVLARQESARLVLRKIKEMCGDEPVILTGDFNVDQTDESYGVLHHSGVFNDSYEVALLRYALNGTFNDFDTNAKTDSRIDHVFVSPSWTVNKYGILTDTYRSGEKGSESDNSHKTYVARIPSDHFPVKVELQYDGKKK